MDPIPETWPPEPPKELPLFALPNVWLFPYVILPLHVFEPRYKQMIEDILDGAGRIVIGSTMPSTGERTNPSGPSRGWSTSRN